MSSFTALVCLAVVLGSAVNCLASPVSGITYNCQDKYGNRYPIGNNQIRPDDNYICNCTLNGDRTTLYCRSPVYRSSSGVLSGGGYSYGSSALDTCTLNGAQYRRGTTFKSIVNGVWMTCTCDINAYLKCYSGTIPVSSPQGDPADKKCRSGQFNNTEQFAVLQPGGYYSVCSCVGRVANCRVLTVSGEECTFPFIYNGQYYSTCAGPNLGQPKFCQTFDGRTSNCITSIQELNTFYGYIFTFGGNSNGARCHFPFTYKGVEYNKCIRLDRAGMWCATTQNYDLDGRYGYCKGHRSTDTVFNRIGERVQLQCVYSNPGNEAVTIRWYKMNGNQKQHIYTYDSATESGTSAATAGLYQGRLSMPDARHLVISGMQIQDTGTFQCEVAYPGRRDTVQRTDVVVGAAPTDLNYTYYPREQKVIFHWTNPETHYDSLKLLYNRVGSRTAAKVDLGPERNSLVTYRRFSPGVPFKVRLYTVTENQESTPATLLFTLPRLSFTGRVLTGSGGETIPTANNPLAPLGIRENELILHWFASPIPDATVDKWIVLYENARTGKAYDVPLSSDVTTYTIRDLTPGTKYRVTLFAVIENNKIEIAKTEVNTEYTPVELTSTIRTVSTTDKSATLSWEPVDTATQYEVKYRDIKYINSPWKTFRIAAQTEPMARLVNLSPATTYDVHITPVANGRLGVYSPTTVTTRVQGPVSPPSNLAFTDVTRSSAVISWEAPEEVVAYYRLSFEPLPAQGGYPFETFVYQTYYTAQPLLRGQPYTVRVTAVTPDNRESTPVTGSFVTVNEVCLVDGVWRGNGEKFFKRHASGHMQNCTCTRLPNGAGRWECDPVVCLINGVQYAVNDTWEQISDNGLFNQQCTCLLRGWRCISTGYASTPQGQLLRETVGGRLVLSCPHETESNFRPTVKWFKIKDGNPVLLYTYHGQLAFGHHETTAGRLSGRMTMNNEIDLIISPVKASDSGRYECTVTYRASKDTETHRTRILAIYGFENWRPSPQITHSESDTWTLSWQQPSQEVDKYIVKYNDIAHPDDVRIITVDNPSVEIDGLLPSTTYQIVVIPVLDGTEGQSKTFTVTTTPEGELPDENPIVEHDDSSTGLPSTQPPSSTRSTTPATTTQPRAAPIIAPRPPLNLLLESIGRTSVTARWRPPYEPSSPNTPQTYRVSYKPQDSDDEPLTQDVSRPLLQVNQLEPGVFYVFEVRTVRNGLTSAPNSRIVSTIPVGRIRVDASNPNRYNRIGETARLLCSYDRSTPGQPTIKWYKSSYSGESDLIYSNNLATQTKVLESSQFDDRLSMPTDTSLEIRDLQGSDDGTYKCQVSYPSGGGTGNTKITLIGVPNPVTFVSPVQGPNEKNYTLSWEVVPTPKINTFILKIRRRGSKSGKYHTFQPPGGARSFHFRGLKPGRTYEGDLVAVNNYGQSSPVDFHFITLPSGLPSPPVKLHLTDFTSEGVNLRVEGPREADFFTIRYGPKNETLGIPTKVVQVYPDDTVRLTELLPETIYLISATTVHQGTESEPIKGTITTPKLRPPAPTSVSIVELLPRKVTFDIEGPYDTSTEFKITYQPTNRITSEQTYRTRPNENRVVLVLEPDVQYRINVQAIKEGLTSPTLSTTLSTPQEESPPAKPTEFVDIVPNVNSVQLYWTGNTENVQYYRIEYKLRSDKIISFYNTPGRQQSATITGLLPNREYDVSVTAVGQGGYSPKLITSFHTKPERPTLEEDSIVVDENQPEEITFTVPSDADYYIVNIQHPTEEPFEMVQYGPTIRITNLQPSTDYKINFTAVKNHIESIPIEVSVSTPDSEAASPEGPSQPQGLQLVEISPNDVTFQVTGPSENVEFYHIEWGPDTQEGNVTIRDTPNSRNEITLTQLTPLTRYKVIVKAVNNGIESYPVTSYFVTKKEPEDDSPTVSNLRVINVGTTQVTATWDQPSNIRQFVSRYVLGYKEDDEDLPPIRLHVAISQTFKHLKNLKPGQSYQISLTAIPQNRDQRFEVLKETFTTLDRPDEPTPAEDRPATTTSSPSEHTESSTTPGRQTRPMRPIRPTRPVRPVRPIPTRPVRPVRPRPRPTQPSKPVQPHSDEPEPIEAQSTSMPTTRPHELPHTSGVGSTAPTATTPTPTYGGGFEEDDEPDDFVPQPTAPNVQTRSSPRPARPTTTPTYGGGFPDESDELEPEPTEPAFGSRPSHTSAHTPKTTPTYGGGFPNERDELEPQPVAPTVRTLPAPSSPRPARPLPRRTTTRPFLQLEAPRGLVVDRRGEDSADISWNPIGDEEDDVDGFLVQYEPFLAGLGTPKSFELPKSETSARLPGLVPGTEYVVYVYTTRGGQQSPATTATFKTHIDSPTNLKAIPSDDRITIRWENPDTKITGTKLEYKRPEQSRWRERIFSSDVTEWVIPIRPDDEQLDVQVSSIGGTILSEPAVIKVVIKTPDDVIIGEPITVNDVTDDSGEIVVDSKLIPATGWILRVIDDQDTMLENLLLPGSYNSYSMSSLQPGREYDVIALYKNGTEFARTQFTTKADKPKYVDTDDVTPTSAEIVWSEPDAPIDGYTVKYKEDGSDDDWTEIPLEPDTTEVSLTDLKPNTLYKVEVVPTYVDKSTQETKKPGVPSVVYLTTQPRQQEPTPTNNAPRPPTNIRFTNVEPTSFTAIWSPSPDVDVDMHRALVRLSSDGSRVMSSNLPNSYATFINLMPNTFYDLIVTAIRDNIPSEPIVAKVYTGKNAPVTVQIVDTSKDSVTVAWEPETDNNLVTAYNVSVQEQDSNEPATSTMYPASTTRTTIYNLKPGTPYEISVTSLIDHVATNPVTSTFITPVPDVERVRFGKITEDSIMVMWDEPDRMINQYLIDYWIRGVVDAGREITNNPQVKLDGLVPNTEYIISVHSMHNRRLSNGTRVSQSTKDVLGAPQDVVLGDVTDSMISVSWRPYDETYRHNVFLYSSAIRPNGVLNKTLEPGVNTINFADLNPSETYRIVVNSVSPTSSAMRRSNPITVTTKPAAPSNFKVTDTGLSYAVLQWRPVRARDYVVTYGPQGGNSRTIRTRNNRIRLNRLFPGTMYDVTVYAVGLRDNLISEPAYLSFVTNEEAPASLPDRFNVEHIKTTGSSVYKVTWTSPDSDVSYNVTYYPVRHPDDVKYVITQPGAPGVDFTELKPGTQYVIELTPLGAEPTLANTVERRFTTDLPKADNVQVTEIDDNNAVVEWDAPQLDNVYYTVRIYQPGQELPVSQGTVDSNSPHFYRLTGLIPGQEYQVDVTARTEETTSNPAGTTFSTKMESPSNVRSDIDYDRVVVNWDSPSNNVTRYKISIRPADDVNNVREVFAYPPRTTYTFYDLLPSTDYFVDVVAENPQRGTESKPGQGSFTTLPRATTTQPPTTTRVSTTRTRPVRPPVRPVHPVRPVRPVRPVHPVRPAATTPGPAPVGDVPNQRPAPVEARPVDKGTFNVSWLAPVTGGVQYYKVIYTSANGQVKQTSVPYYLTHVQLKNLLPSTDYTVNVTAVLRTGEELTLGVLDLPILETTGSRTFTLEWDDQQSDYDMIRIVATPTDRRSGADQIILHKQPNETHVWLQGLHPGTEYTVRVEGLTSLGYITIYETTVQTEIDGPSNLRAVKIKPRRVTLLWDKPVAEIYQYLLSYQLNGVGPETTLKALPKKTTRTHIKNLKPDNWYLIRLYARTNTSESRPARLWVKTENDISDTTQVSNQNGILLKWKAHSRQVTGWKIVLEPHDGGEPVEMFTEKITKKFQLTNLKEGVPYTVKIFPRYGRNNFGNPSIINIPAWRHQTTRISTLNRVDVQSFPWELRVPQLESDTLTLRWSRPWFNVKSYTLYYKLRDEPDSEYMPVIPRPQPNDTSAVITGLTPGQAYTIQLNVTHDDSYGSLTSTVTINIATLLPEVSGVTITRSESGNFVLNWQPISGIEHYVIKYRPHGQEDYVTRKLLPYESSFTLPSPSPGTQYEIQFYTESGEFKSNTLFFTVNIPAALPDNCVEQSGVTRELAEVWRAKINGRTMMCNCTSPQTIECSSGAWCEFGDETYNIGDSWLRELESGEVQHCLCSRASEYQCFSRSCYDNGRWYSNRDTWIHQGSLSCSCNCPEDQTQACQTSCSSLNRQRRVQPRRGDA